jgi:hypothetical protein
MDLVHGIRPREHTFEDGVWYAILPARHSTSARKGELTER